jgi:D-alanine-D-alanine ligase
VRVALLAGGRSSEHDVSLASARSVIEALESSGHDCRPLVIGRDGVWRLRDPRDDAAPDGEAVAIEPGAGLLDAEVVFPVLHGVFGEDGTVQGLLECAGVAYVGAGVLASALCMDKLVFKRLMAQAGMPQVDFEPVLAPEWGSGREAALERVRRIPLPRFVKPARAGSSFGISKVTSEQELEPALEAAFAHDPRVLVEAAAGGMEIECAVIGNDEPVASEPGQVVPKADWYDYEAKYSEGGMELVVPAPLGDSQRERVRRLAQDTFTSSGCAGLARVDFFVTDEGQVLVNELNTMPGFTPTSVFPRLFDASGLPYPELLDRLLGYALERHEREQQYSY